MDLKGPRDSNLEAMQQRYRGPSEDKKKFSRQKVTRGKGGGVLSLMT